MQQVRQDLDSCVIWVMGILGLLMLFALFLYMLKTLLKTNLPGTSLVVQWVRLCAPNAGGLGLIPGWELQSTYMPQLRARLPQLKDPACRN